MNEKFFFMDAPLSFFSKILLLSLLYCLLIHLFFISFPQVAFAQDCENSRFGCFEVPFSNTDPSIDSFVENNSLVNYVDLVAKFITGLIVATGLICVVAAGYVYMTAGGDGGKVETAKTMIKAALLGIILALSAFLILNTISPQFASDVPDPLFGQ